LDTKTWPRYKTGISEFSARHLFDHLVGSGEQSRRHAQTERLRRLEIECQVELDDLLDRQIDRFGTLEDPSRINARLTMRFGNTASIADQAAGRDEIARERCQSPDWPLTSRYYLQITRSSHPGFCIHQE